MTELEVQHIALVDCKRDSLVEWLAEHPEVQVVLLRERSGRGGATRIRIPDRWSIFDFDSRQDVAAEAQRLRRWCEHETVRLSHWVNQNEELMEFSAGLADALGIPSITPEQAYRVRDKLAMKDVYQELSIPHARGVEVANEDEAREFVDKVGLPVILKPVSADACRGALKISQPSDLETCRVEWDAFDRWMVEEFVPGPEYQLCALISRGQVIDTFVSSNPVNLIEVLDGGMNANITLAEGEAQSFPVRDIVQRVADRLGLRDCYFHAEFFQHPEHGVTMGEMAARMSGCEVVRNHGAASGADIIASIVNIYTKREPQWSPRGRHSVGDLLLPAAEGLVKDHTSAHHLRSLPGVVRVEYAYEKGDYIAYERNSGWAFGNVQVEGPDSAVVQERMQAVLDSFSLVVAQPC